MVHLERSDSVHGGHGSVVWLLTAPDRARTGPEMTDYFALMTRVELKGVRRASYPQLTGSG